MKPKFTHLHVHSHYSLLDGLSKIPNLLDRVKELGMDSVAITDHGVLYSIIEFYKEAKKRDIKPIFGMEAYVAARSMHDKQPGIDDKRFHLTLIAKNNRGYKNLLKLSSKSHLEGFYYKPRIDKALLRKHSAGLIALSGCLTGEIPKAILAGNKKDAEDTAKKYAEIFGKDNFYLELQHHPNIPEQGKVNKALIELSKKLSLPLVATQDSHYLRPEDSEAHDILLAIQTGEKTTDEGRGLMMKDEDFSIISPEDMHEAFKDIPEALRNTQKIAEECDVEIELGKYQLPNFEVPEGYSEDTYLEKLSKGGLEKRYGTKKSDKEILDRLSYELSVIKQMGFASYFLIVQDFVNWAKDRGIIVGPGRGSSAGSIVSYLLNITNVDPLKYDLIFERFLQQDRNELPDIDIDFADTRRDEVLEYVAQKYGRENVAQIITFGTMAARAAVRDAGRALDYPYDFCDKVAKTIPMMMNFEQAIKESQEFAILYNTDREAKRLVNAARKLEGVARHASTHACGVVITKDPLTNTIPLQLSSHGDNAVISQYEMHSIEDLGLLKMDFLGLKNLTIIQNAREQIKERHGIDIDLDKIPLDDEKTLELLQKANTTGVFQLECLTGDTLVSNTTIKNLYKNRNKSVLESVYLDEGKIHKNKIKNVFRSGKKETYTLIAENNRYIKATKNHYFLTENGWKKLGTLSPGEKILVKTKSRHLVYNTCKICKKQISGQKEGQSRFCYVCSASFYKNPSKRKSREKIRAARIRFYQQGGTPWNTGLTAKSNKTLWENGRKISQALTGRSLEDRVGKARAKRLREKSSQRMRGQGNHMFGRPSPHRKGGFREDLKHYVRSNWEADFARILKLHNVKYYYEYKKFRLTSAAGEIFHYTPDFYTPHNNTFYEIKGWMHELDEKKIKLFQKQYPQYNFVLINTTKFAELALKYKNLIKWECPQIPTKSFEFIKIKKIKYNGHEETYDISMESPGNNFVANGFLVHNSSGMKRYLKELKPNRFEDIIAMVALYRPGPMELIPDFINRKLGKTEIRYLHPKLEPILKNTYGIAVYQEQVLQIARELAGFSYSEADVLRKAIGKKIKELLEEQREKFIKGMMKNDIDQRIAERLFTFVEPFARYGFNKAHSTCYATIGFHTAYLKAHYPKEFMAALLNAEQKNIERISFLIGEARGMGIKVLPPDINESDKGFGVSEAGIRFGMAAVKNVGEHIVEEIIKERDKHGEFQSIENLLERIHDRDLNKKSLESLIKCGALDKLEERSKLLQNIESILKYAKNQKAIKDSGQTSLFADQPMFASSLTLQGMEPATKQQALAWEKELLGFYISSHPLEEFKDKLTGFPKIKTITSRDSGKTMKIAGILSGIKKIVTKSGQPMLFVGIEDLSSKIEGIVFPSILEKYPEMFIEGKILQIKGRISTKDGEPKVLCEEVKEL